MPSQASKSARIPESRQHRPGVVPEAENGVVRQHKITEIRDLGTEMEVSEGVKSGDLGRGEPARRSRRWQEGQNLHRRRGTLSSARYSGEVVSFTNPAPCLHHWIFRRDREFANSSLEGGVSCELVSENAQIPC